MKWNFDHAGEDRAIFVDIHGGPYDRNVESPAVMALIDPTLDLNAAIANAVLAQTRGQKGAEFRLPSWGELTRTIVRPHGIAAISLHRYRITDVEESDEAILMTAKHIC